MKKANLIIALALGIAGTQAYGQGTINFANNSASRITNSLTMANVVAGSTFRVQLYFEHDDPVAPAMDQMISLATIGPSHASSAPGNISPAAGLFGAGTRTSPAPLGGFGWYQVRCWETAFGATYEQAVANTVTQNGRLALAGFSNIIRVKAGDPTAGVTPGSLTAAGLQGFVVTVVPEPSAIGFAAMGIGALLLLRRKK